MENVPRPNTRSIAETVLLLLLFLLLIVALYEVMQAFFGALTFALIFSVSFHSLFEKFARVLKNRRKLAAVIYAIILLVIVVLPFIYIISAFTHHVKDLMDWLNETRANGLPALPAWLTSLPFVGGDISHFWQQLQLQPKDVLASHDHQVKGILHLILTRGAGILGSAIEVIVGVIVSAIFLVSTEKIITPFRMAMKHILGEPDAMALENAAINAVRGVSIGVMGTAFIAAVVAWVGLTIAGIPFALGLSALVFFLVLIQVGPLLLWIPLIIWMIAEGHTNWAIFLAAYGALLMGVDSVLKPILIAKSGKMPFLVLFVGVIGGLVAWGFTGMFKGAIIVTLFYTVFNSWLEKKNREAAEGV